MAATMLSGWEDVLAAERIAIVAGAVVGSGGRQQVVVGELAASLETIDPGEAVLGPVRHGQRDRRARPNRRRSA